MSLGGVAWKGRLMGSWPSGIFAGGEAEVMSWGVACGRYFMHSYFLSLSCLPFYPDGSCFAPPPSPAVLFCFLMAKTHGAQ
jgi:hypothetical protein